MLTHAARAAAPLAAAPLAAAPLVAARGAREGLWLEQNLIHFETAAAECRPARGGPDMTSGTGNVEKSRAAR